MGSFSQRGTTRFKGEPPSSGSVPRLLARSGLAPSDPPRGDPSSAASRRGSAASPRRVWPVEDRGIGGSEIGQGMTAR